MTISANYPTVRPTLSLDFAKTKALDPRITFTRSTTATYYDGVTNALAEQNLLLYSQGAFSNQTYWDNTFYVVATDNTTIAPNGTTTASTLTISGTAGANAFFQTNGTTVNPSTTYTFSFYALRGTATDMAYAVYNLSSGSFIVSPTSYYSSTNSSTWSRISVTFTTPAGCTSIRNYISSNSNSLGTFYVWGAQLEQRSSVTAYNATTTTAITNYIPVLQTAAANIPRFDCNPTTGESLGLLIEQQSTNLATYSSNLAGASWANSNCTINATSTIAPDGTLTANLYTATTTAANAYQQIVSLGAGTYSMSVYLKRGSVATVALGIVNVLDAISYNFDTGAVGGLATANTTVTSVGNGWVRIQFFYACSAGNFGPSIKIATAGGTVFAWGVQFELGSFATSYIPTTSAAVTRVADNATITGTNFSSWYNQGFNTTYAEYLCTNGATNQRVFVYDLSTAATYTNLIAVTKQATTQDIGVVNATTSQWSSSPTASNTIYNKTALADATNIYAAASNGSIVTSGSTGISPSINSLYIGYYRDSTSFNGRIKKLSYYPAALTSTQLQALTGS